MSTRSTMNTDMHLLSCVLEGDHKALEEYFMNNPLRQIDLDMCLLHGLLCVQWESRKLYHVAPVLTVLLRFGAKWNSDVLLDNQKTPYHVICESPGDHQELLDLMIESSQQAIIDKQDINKRTALLYAVRNANINCLKSLITNGADVNTGDDKRRTFVQEAPLQQWLPIMEAIKIMDCAYSEHSSAIMADILDVLLDTGVDLNKTYFNNCASLITYAASLAKVDCVMKLIKKGIRLDSKDHTGYPVWPVLAKLGNNELLKCMFNHGLDKDSVDPDGLSVLWWVATSGNINAVRYLLDFGVTIPTYSPEVHDNYLQWGNENMLVHVVSHNKYDSDPYMEAIRYNMLDVVILLDEYGWQSWKSFDALRRAVTYGSVDVMSYLLNKYSYPLNVEYIQIESDGRKYVYTLLTEPRSMGSVDITKVLLDHGADAAKPVRVAGGTYYTTAIIAAIYQGKFKIIAQYIRSGVNMNVRSSLHGMQFALPFEASVLEGRRSIAQMLLVSGCSCGVFSLNNNSKYSPNFTLEMDKLLKEWNVHKNNVTPLKQRCRSMILNHLSDDKKIRKLPLPQGLIKFLSIPDLEKEEI